MKRKFLSFLMLGALVVAATSLTSCKDYDDDIQNLQSQITNNLKALEDAKADLQAQITSLQGRIEKAEGELKAHQTLLNGLRTDVNNNAEAITKLQGQVADNAGKIAALEARMKTAEDALKEINGLIKDLQDNKVDKSVFNEKVQDIYAKFETIETDLGKALKDIETLKKGLDDEITARKAAVADLQQQLDAVKKFEARIKAIEDDYLKKADKTELENKIKKVNDDLTEALNKAKEDLTKAIDKAKNDAISASKEYTDQEIGKLKTQLEALSKKVDALQEEVNVLNVLVKNSLRSLVFIPDGYYHGVEATSFGYLEAYNFKIPAAKWNVVETRGFYNDPKETQIDLAAEDVARTIHNRYDSTKVALVEDLWAHYHLNPSNVDVENFANVEILSGDKWFENTRTATKADAGLSMKSYNVKDGILNVQIDVKNPEQIKAVMEEYWAEGQDRPMITNFASQVTLNKAGKQDTTITSDYATLFADKITDLRLAHIDNNKNATGQANTHCGVCEISNRSHVMATVHEAATIAKQNEEANTNAQDVVNYKETLDLRNLVETHWTTLDGSHKKMTAADLKKFGLSYKFELTSFKLGNNETDESSHAAILDDGYTFRPQLPRKVGENKYEQVDPNATDIANFIGDNALQSVGRTPMVRVSLVDEDGNVFDYGYIRIEIVKKAIEVPYEFKEVIYAGADKAYQDVCPRITPEGYEVYATKWIQTEYDIYKNALGIDRETFEQHFNEDPVRDEQNDFQQYEKKNGTYVARTPDQYVGIITNEPDMDDETHTQTSTLKWELTDNDVQALYAKWDKKTEKTFELHTAVKYEDIHGQNAHYSDVYVMFTTKVTFKPYSQTDLQVKVDWSKAKIAKYWYVKNTAEMGDDELHTNVPSVEDALRADADSLTNLFSNEFFNNEVVSKTIVTGGTGFNYNNYKYRLVFDKANNSKRFKGADGKTYTLKVSDDGRELLARSGNGSYMSVAKLVIPEKFANKEGTREEANYTMIEYQHSKAAHALLNYCSHKEFNDKNDAVLDDFLNVIISLAVQNDDECQPINVENGSFNVRFLRPIDVTNANKSIQDASSSGKQTIQLNGLFDYKDWRNAWKAGYYEYYGIKGIKVDGLTDGDPLSDNHKVMADLNNTGMKALYTITGQLDFTYHEAENGNYLEYNNLSSTVQEFKLEIPVIVEYIWGEFNTTATVTVKRTQDNAKQF